MSKRTFSIEDFLGYTKVVTKYKVIFIYIIFKI